MKPIVTENTNVKYTGRGFGDLPATLFQNADGNTELETCWELTDEEIEIITKNRRVYLYFLGRSVPPVAIEAKSILPPGGAYGEATAGRLER